MEKVKIKSLKKSKQIYNTSAALEDEEVRRSLKDLQTKLCIASIDKASNNFSFVCEQSYVSKLLDKIELRSTQSYTYKLVNKLKEEVTDDNIGFSSKSDFEVQNDFKHCP